VVCQTFHVLSQCNQVNFCFPSSVTNLMMKGDCQIDSSVCGVSCSSNVSPSPSKRMVCFVAQFLLQDLSEENREVKTQLDWADGWHVPAKDKADVLPQRLFLFGTLVSSTTASEINTAPLSSQQPPVRIFYE
jgi:hypothetical protein